MTANPVGGARRRPIPNQRAAGHGSLQGPRTPTGAAPYDHLVKPFLLLATRAEDAAADNEYASFLAFAGLEERDLRRVRLEDRPLGTVDLQDWSGVFLGGGPFNSSDPQD